MQCRAVFAVQRSTHVARRRLALRCGACVRWLPPPAWASQSLIDRLLCGFVFVMFCVLCSAVVVAVLASLLSL